MVCPDCWSLKGWCSFCRGAGRVSDVRLSPNFWLSEFLKSNKALRNGFSQVPAEAQVANMRRLCVELLEPLRAIHGGPVEVTSGIRVSLELNELIGGSATSSSLYLGEADHADTAWPVPRREVMETLARGRLAFDQAIFEERVTSAGVSKWLHLSSRHTSGRQRRQLLMCFRNGKYEQWSPNDPRVMS